MPQFINYHLKSGVSIMLYCQLCSTHYTAVRIKNCSKSTTAIKVATTKNMDDFCHKGKPSHATTKSTPFAVSQEEWDTKQDTGKSMKNALYVLWYAKRHLSGWSDVKQWKNQARSLCHYRVTLIWRHQSDSVSQLLSQHKIPFNNLKKIPLQLVESISGRSEGLFGLSFT